MSSSSIQGVDAHQLTLQAPCCHMQGPGRPKKARRSTGEQEDWSDSASLGLSDPEQLDGSEDEGRLVS